MGRFDVLKTVIIHLFFTFTLFTFNSSPGFSGSLPPNNLWKQDPLYLKSLNQLYTAPSVAELSTQNSDDVTEELFNKIIDTGLEFFKPLANQRGEDIVVEKEWEDPEVDGQMTRSGNTVTITMFGGLARRPEIRAEGLSLIFCHEIGHVFGAPPLENGYAVEGEADYYGARFCAREIIKRLNLTQPPQYLTGFMQKTCTANFQDSASGEVCMRALSAGQQLGNLLAVIDMQKSKPNYETPDPYVTPELIRVYPKTNQCRLDTYFAGALDKERPLCWYKAGQLNDRNRIITQPKKEGYL